MIKRIPLLFANCVIVNGASRSIICDLQRNNYIVIPTDLYHILKNYRGLSVSDIKNKYNNKYDTVINEYFDILIENEFAFLTDTPELFPQLSHQWFSPFKITNAIIDIGEDKTYLNNILRQLSELNCKFIQLRFFNEITFNEISNIFKNLDDMKANILGVDLCLTFSKSFENANMSKFLDQNRRLSSLVFYNSPNNKSINRLDGTRYIIHTSTQLISKKSCGLINNNMFTINVKNYTESIHHNSCLNRKISIDVNGDIKNCPSMPQSFGNIKNTSLEEAINHKDFKKYWNITKDQIEVCKDCEFRYVCTDCRAYTERTTFNNEAIDLSKPLKCGYNPYTNEWEEWSINPLKQKAIDYYEMQDLVKKND